MQVVVEEDVGMKGIERERERELQKCKKGSSQNSAPGGHMAASRPLAVSIPEACTLSVRARPVGGHLAASHVITWRLADSWRLAFQNATFDRGTMVTWQLPGDQLTDHAES